MNPEGFGFFRVAGGGAQLLELVPASGLLPYAVPGVVTLEMFGAADVGLGQVPTPATDAAALTSALAFLSTSIVLGGASTLLLGGRTYNVGIHHVVPAGASVVGFGPASNLATTANGASGTQGVLETGGPGCSFSSFTVSGNAVGANQNGIVSEFRITQFDSVNASNLGGWGFLLYTPTDSPTPVHQGPQLVNCRATNCIGGGFEAQAEYSTFADCYAGGNGIGFYVYAGNVVWTGGTIGDNTTGVYLFPSGNDTHGVVSGANIKHNLTNVYAGAIQNGEVFVGCSIYQGPIQLVSSVGVEFIGCQINVTDLFFDGSQGSAFKGCLWGGSPAESGTQYQNNVHHSFNAHLSTTRFDADNYDLQGNYPSFLVPDATVWGIGLPTLLVGATLLCWLRADLGVVVVGGGVSRWLDQSGTGDANKNAVQATPAKRPTLNAADVAYNGWQTLSVASAAGQFLQQVAWAVPPSQPITVFVVGNSDGTGTAQAFFDGIGVAGRNLVYNPGADYNAFAGTALVDPAGVDNHPHIFAVAFDGATAGAFYKDALTPVATGAVGVQNAAAFTLGGDYTGATNLNGKLAEFIVYAGLLSASQTTAVLRYLSARYGIPLGP